MNLLSTLFLLFVSSVLKAETLENRIFGGWFERVNGSPIAFLTDGRGSCSGVVIGNSSVLTAKHCIRRSNYVGINGVFHKRVSHSSYRGSDIAIIKVNSRFPVRSLSVKSGLKLRSGNLLLVKGFGLPNVGYLSAGYMVFERHEGKRFYASSFNGQNACEGDSGGPAIVNYRGRATVVGLVSQGPKVSCRPGLFAIFASTTHNDLVRWINRHK